MDAKIKSYFERYPKNDEVFENGGVLFHTKGAADSFGKSETKKYTRAELTAETSEVPEVELTEEQKQAAKEAAEKEAAELVKAEAEKLKTADIEKMDYNEMKRLVTLFKLAADDQKKETYIALLTSFKNSLNTPE